MKVRYLVSLLVLLCLGHVWADRERLEEWWEWKYRPVFRLLESRTGTLRFGGVTRDPAAAGGNCVCVTLLSTTERVNLGIFGWTVPKRYRGYGPTVQVATQRLWWEMATEAERKLWPDLF